ncbi:MAG: Gfo/Idh/MocA family protein [Thermogutta sp.]
MMAKEASLRGVCIGAGYFSHYHYDAWQRIPEVEIVAFCSRDPKRIQAVQERFGIARVYGDYREMLDCEKPDFVDIITPPPTHLEMCQEAAKRGIHIICQKPLAPTLEEAKTLVDVVIASGVRFMVHENFRFQPWYRKIKQILTEGTLGQIFSLYIQTRMGDGWGENAYLDRQPYFRDYPRLLIYETGVHFIDTFRYLLGEIGRVTAWLRRLNPVIAGEDCGLVVCEFLLGAIGVWDANRYNEANYPNPRYTFGQTLLEGERGSIRVYPDGRLTLQLLGTSEETVEYRPSQHGFAGDCCYAAQRHFVDGLLAGTPFETSGEDYLKTLTVQEAVYQSAATGQPVAVVLS